MAASLDVLHTPGHVCPNLGCRTIISSVDCTSFSIDEYCLVAGGVVDALGPVVEDLKEQEEQEGHGDEESDLEQVFVEH